MGCLVRPRCKPWGALIAAHPRLVPHREKTRLWASAYIVLTKKFAATPQFQLSL